MAYKKQIKPEVDIVAIIKIDTDRVRGAVSKRFFGFFTEHLSRILYNGIFESGSPLSDENGFRKDVLEAVKAYSPATLRWPGGNYASAYDWKKGVGPLKDRRPVYDPVWRVIEPNSFGTDEFVRYCRLVDAEPYICINLGDGTQREAMKWVEYCNLKSGSETADMRVKNGAEEPYGVKLWGLGNELCGDWQLGHKDAGTYAASALEYAKAMRAVDPDIELVAAGGIHMRMGFEHIERNWDRIVLEKLAGTIDFIGLHFYARKLPGSSGEDAGYRQHMSEPEWLDKNIKILKGEIERAKYHMPGKECRDIRIAVDEVGVCVEPEHFSDLQDALVSACLLNTLINNADVVDFCSYTSISNVFAPIFTSPDDMVLQTIHYVLEAYTSAASANALDVFVNCPTFNCDPLDDLPLLHVSATSDEENGTVDLFVVNRDPSGEIEADIVCQNGNWCGTAEANELNGASLDSANSFDDKYNVKIKKREIPTGGRSVLSYVFPAHSFTAIKLQSNDINRKEG